MPRLICLECIIWIFVYCFESLENFWVRSVVGIYIAARIFKRVLGATFGTSWIMVPFAVLTSWSGCAALYVALSCSGSGVVAASTFDSMHRNNGLELD